MNQGYVMAGVEIESSGQVSFIDPKASGKSSRGGAR